MKSALYRSSLIVTFVLVSASPLPTGAQTVPPATSATDTTRPNFSGTWSLDRGISNDPAQASFDAPRNQNGQRSGGSGGSRSRGGFGGGGFGGGGGYGGSRSGNRNLPPAPSTDEQARLKALTDQLKTEFTTLVISHHDPSFVINDAKDHTQFFQTTGSTDDHQLGTVTVSSTTRWDGPRLITEYSLSSRQKLVYTFTMLPATKQLVLRVRLDATEGRRTEGAELKLVYKQASSDTK
jgi:hypothetical protein